MINFTLVTYSCIPILRLGYSHSLPTFQQNLRTGAYLCTSIEVLRVGSKTNAYLYEHAFSPVLVLENAWCMYFITAQVSTHSTDSDSHKLINNFHLGHILDSNAYSAAWTPNLHLAKTQNKQQIGDAGISTRRVRYLNSKTLRRPCARLIITFKLHKSNELKLQINQETRAKPICTHMSLKMSPI